MGFEPTNGFGLIAFDGLAMTEGVALAAIAFAIVEVILLGFAPAINQGDHSGFCSDMPLHLLGNPRPPELALAPFLYFALTASRLLVLLPFFPIVTRTAADYVTYLNPSTDAAEAGGSTNETSNLLTVSNADYGPFYHLLEAPRSIPGTYTTLRRNSVQPNQPR
ncbi:hypothetical protein FRB98_007256 [Tulasnella sp. 332]|nr:hypothetical protein FRB98_007256 [Tulasnella sp. 332]